MAKHHFIAVSTLVLSMAATVAVADTPTTAQPSTATTTAQPLTATTTAQPSTATTTAQPLTTATTGQPNVSPACQAYWAKDSTQPNVVTLPSGLQYTILTAGSGPSPQADDTITANYKGELTDGTVFDSSYKRNQPLVFKASQVIKGWGQALALMKAGSVWKMCIPANLAYGTQGSGNVIPPNASLVFKVQLMSFQPTSPTG